MQNDLLELANKFNPCLTPLWSSGVFREYKMGNLARNGLRSRLPFTVTKRKIKYEKQQVAVVY